jgi:1-acyl-sn-glycerol-3-phosphate acyltransferase
MVDGGFGRVMLEMALHFWRVFGAGVSFSLVGAAGVLVFPLLNLILWRRSWRREVARSVIWFAFRTIVDIMNALRVIRVDISGLERLERRGLLILANHPSLIDVVLLMAFVKRADCIIKRGVWRNPFTHATVRAADYIRNDSGPELIQKCIASLKSGSNLIIFPEGTRTPADGSIRLKRGAANIAIRTTHNVTPVLIHCTPAMIGKGRQFWRTLSRSVHYHIEVGEDIDTQQFIKQAQSETLAARRLTRYLQDYFSGERASYAA